MDFAFRCPAFTLFKGKMKLDDVKKLEIGDLITFCEEERNPELGLVVGRTEKKVEIEWIEEERPFVGRYIYRGPATQSYFWDAIEKVS